VEPCEAKKMIFKYYTKTPKTASAVLRVRDVEGGEAGANWNKRRYEIDMMTTFS
jgi:hypothetical protein